MSYKKLATRWRISVENDLAGEKIFNVFKHGGVLSMDHSPFGRLGSDLIDFKGYNAIQILVKDVVLKDIDLSYADFSSSWMQANRFENCLFEKTDFSDIADHGNTFSHCVFKKCDFKLAVLGYEGSQYKNCTFKACSFQRTNFIRAEFVSTDFVDCRLKSIDFSGSSFENCKFEGLLDDVWFRGTYGYESYFTEFGQPKPNKMDNVSFENADLRNPAFSDGCDLTTVKVKNDGRHFKFDNWLKRLQFLEKEIENWEDGHHKNEAAIFVKVYLVHAPKQDWNIINLEDLERSYGGADVAHKIIGILNSYP
jgi:uncharacterized protein YjbI with pentapeptide repeats